MQLGKLGKGKPSTSSKSIASALTAATLSLLGTSVKADGDFWDFSKDWKFNSGVLYYGEQDRVSALEGVFSATHEKEYNDKFNFKVVIDSLTGASPSGAVAQPGVQTFTRPSGKSSYTVTAEEIPLDDTFRDTRVQFNAQWTHPLFEDSLTSYGVHLSKEYDYLSLGFNGSFSWDFNQKNSTLSLGLSLSKDTFEPEGEIPVALIPMVIDQGQFASQADFDAAFGATRGLDSDDKDTTDVLLGWTQVINRTTLMQFNYSFSDVSGYLSDPFKVISTVDASGGAVEHLYENRPDKRAKHSFYWQTKHHFESSVMDISFRYMTDDWEIDSQTIDFKQHIWLKGNRYIEPQIRWYQQSAAEFYQPYLIASAPLPEFASADTRLGEFSAFTVGLKYGWQTNGGNNMAVRLSYYQQSQDDVLSNHPGVLNSLDVYPELKAFFVQYTYDF